MKRTRRPITVPDPAYRKWKPDNIRQVELLAKLGAIQEEVCDFFQISERTLRMWRKIPEFNAAWRRGAMEADMNVAHSLYKRATGFTYQEDKIVVVNGDVMRVPITKMVAPDTTAAIFWLKNRQREKWTDVNRMNMYVDHGGKIEHIHSQLKELPTGELSDHAKDILFEITKKQVEHATQNN